MRIVQAAAAAVHAGVRVRALLPSRGPSQVRHRPQGLRRQQCQQDAAGPFNSPIPWIHESFIS
jgi:hypothetical protein